MSPTDYQACLDSACDLGAYLDEVSRASEVEVPTRIQKLLDHISAANLETGRDTLRGILLHFAISIMEDRCAPASA